MAPITFPYAPGFADVPDSALEPEEFAQGVLLGRINENAAMGMVRPEVFTGTYSNSDTVALPVSPVDGYKYSRDELNYMWSLNGLADRKTGIDSFDMPFWFAQWFIDQDTGLVTCEKYYSNDSGSKTQKTNDSVLRVYTFANRRKNTMTMASVPWYKAHPDTDFAIDKALHSTPLTDLSRNAKFSIVASESIYMGTYKSLDKVAMPISSVDGYEYTAAEVIWVWSWVWTTNGASYTPPSHHLSQMHQMRAHVDADGTVHTNIHFYNSGDIDMGDDNGRIAVMALTQRNGTGGQFISAAQIRKDFVAVLGPYTVGVRFNGVRLNADLPSDAVITGIYPTIRAKSTGGTSDAEVVWGTSLPAFDGGIYTAGFGIKSGVFADAQYNASSIGTSLSTLSTWGIAGFITRSTPISGLVTFYTPTDILEIEEVGFAIYYTSATPTTDTIMNPPISVPPGSGVAWAIPTHADQFGDATIHKGTPVQAPTVIVPGGGVWAWVDSADLSGGKPLRTDLLAQVNENANVAVLRPEFFDAGDFLNGQTVPVSVSPIDGYIYTRDECVYVWEMGDTGLNTSGNIRILTWNAWVLSNGQVEISMLHLRDGGHLSWDNEGTLRVKVFATRSAAYAATPSAGGDTTTSGDIPPDTAVDGITIVIDPETGVISGTGVSFGGAWSASGAYRRGTIVTYNSTAYINILDIDETLVPAFVQSAANNGSHTIPFVSHVVKGNLLVVCIGDVGVSAGLSGPPTDTIATPYRLVGTSGGPGLYASIGAMYVGIAPASGPNTVSFSSSGTPRSAIAEFSGVSDAIGVSSAIISSYTDTLSPTASAMLVCGLLDHNNTLSVTGSGGLTVDSQSTGSAIGHLAEGGSGTFTFGFVPTGGANPCLISAAFLDGGVTPDLDTSHWIPLGTVNPMTQVGDMIIGGTGGLETRLAAAAAGLVLTSNGPLVAPSYQATAATPLPSGAANKVVATPDGTSGISSLRSLVGADLPVATTSVKGAVKPDGVGIKVDGSGNITLQFSAGFIIASGVVANTITPPGRLIALRSGAITKCKVVVNASDGSTALTFRIMKNGVDIFLSDPTIAAGAAAGALSTYTNFTTAPLPVAADDIFTIDIMSGTSSWSFTAELG